MSKIYDAFMFATELDLLEVRLNILNEYVDYFIVSESNHTHIGTEKPFNFLENKKRYKKFEHKIIYNMIEDSPMNTDTWGREVYERNGIIRGLKNCNSNDIILTSDADEIPDPKVLSSLNKNNLNGLYLLNQRMFYYYMNVEKDDDWVGTRLCRFDYLLDHTIDDIREPVRKPGEQRIKNGGWHFSYLGGADVIRKKIEIYSHQEYNRDDIKSRIQYNIDNNKDLYGRDTVLRDIHIDESFPEYIRDNYEKYPHFFK